MTVNTRNLLFFSAGFGIGTGLTWIFLKKKYQKEKETEISEVREVYSRKEQELKKREEELLKLAEKNDEEKGPDIESYMAKRKAEFEASRKSYFDQLDAFGYSSPEMREEDEENDQPIEGRPYVITPREFGERDGYDTCSFTFFEDGVLADENGEEMAPEEIENTIGQDSLTRFGEYEDDSVYVRNERHRCDYCVLLDERDYSDYLATRPKPVLMEDV